MDDLFKKFSQSQEDVFKAYWELTDDKNGGGIDQAKAFYDTVQNMVDSDFYESDDARVTLFMMDSVQNKKECRAILPEDIDTYLRDRLAITMNALEVVNHLTPLMGEFRRSLGKLKSNYIGFFDEGSGTKLQGMFRDQVQHDVMSLYVTAQKAIRQDTEEVEAATLLFGLEEVDVLLKNADLTRDNVSHNHKFLHEYLSESLPEMDMSLPGPGND